MENKPQVPTLGAAKDKEEKKGAPLLKIRGLASHGGTLLERLKQFKKKDLAFILAGLGVLFMAPLAEHFMMAPENGDDSLKPGFSRGAGNLFGSGSSPYETGVNGMAPGGVAGGGSDVITPLNVRDPSALVMGPGATQQAPAGVPQASAPPPPKEDSSKWNDAVSAAKAGASAAARSGGLPVPKVPLSAGGLRGLGAISGGSGASYALPPVSSNGLAPNKAADSHSLSGTNGSGIKGVARGPGSGASGNLDALKSKANLQGGDFNHGSAATALENAANRDMHGGDGSGVSPKDGDKDKGPSGSQTKDSKSTGDPCGGSLSQKLACQDAEKALDLKWKLKEKAAMMWPNLKEKMLEEAVLTPEKALTKAVGDSIGAMLSPVGSGYECDNGLSVTSSCSGDKPASCVTKDGYYVDETHTRTQIKCQRKGSGTSAGPQNANHSVNGGTQPPGQTRSQQDAAAIAADCNGMKQMVASAGNGHATSNQHLIDTYRHLLVGKCTVAQSDQNLRGNVSAAIQACCH